MDDNELIGVYVKSLEIFVRDFFLCQPSMECYLADKKAGTCVKGNSADSNIFSYKSTYSLIEEDVYRRSNSGNWNKLLVIDVKFSDLNSEDKILFLEISKNVPNRKTKEIEKKRIIWAFLVPLASDGSMNTNQDLKLQLYKVRKNCKISHQDCNIYHLYSEHKLKKFLGYLEICVKGIIPIKEKITENIEPQKKTKSDLEEKLTAQFSPISKPLFRTWEWSRLPTQSCKVPNKIHKTQSMGKHGVSCLQFSRSGAKIALAVQYQIIIQEVISGEEVTALKSHIGHIYELDWSADDEYLLSVSNDCSGAIWNLKQKLPVFVLPHPSYVYCGRWLGTKDHIVTGGKDHIIRCWCRNNDKFDLIEEIPGHSGYISVITTQDNSFIFSGDSRGYVLIRKFSQGAWILQKQIFIAESIVDSIHLHSSRRRIIVSIRSRGSYLIDVFSGIILQAYKSAINPLSRSVSSLTPCGSFLFGFCQNGDVGVWETNTGKLFAIYENLFPVERLSELSGYIHYHPFEHMLGISALGPNYPLLILRYETSKKEDSKLLNLTFKYSEKKLESEFIAPLLTSRSINVSGKIG